MADALPHLRSVPATSAGECRDPRLRPFVEHLERSRWAMELFDANWRLMWVSRELKILLGEDDEDALGYGEHILDGRERKAWVRMMTEAGKLRWARANLPQILHDMPEAEVATVAERVEPELREMVEGIRPKRWPMWVTHFDFVHNDLPPSEASGLGIRLHDDDGAFLGIVFVYGSSLPASVLALVARGDLGMFERAIRLMEPGRRQAAVLFADLERSVALSRRLPTSAYFRLVREVTTAIDAVVIREQGMVGKHAGDGVTAFFLAADEGTPSAAARAAIVAARDIPGAVAEAARVVDPDGDLIAPGELHVNIGLHWSGTLYMGQIVSGGRLEVTALGDEVNETARVQEAAGGGQVLATKALLERLSPEDAITLRLAPDQVRYRTVAELPDASDKAVRDAGAIPVAALRDPARTVSGPA